MSAFSGSHGRQTADLGIHVVHAYEFANATDRSAFTNEANSRPTPVAADIGRVARQTDNESFWILTNHSPVTWIQMGFGGAATIDHGLLIGLSDDDHTQYLNNARHALIGGNPHGVTAVQAGADPAGTASAAIAVHVALPNPHSQYLQTSALDAALATYLNRTHFRNAVAANNNTTTFTNFISQTVSFAHVALYRVSASFTWSLNSVSSDFQARLQVNGTPVTVDMIEEPGDSAGAGPFGTNQRYKTTMTGIFSNPSVASLTVQLQFACGTAGNNAAMYEADLFVERFL